MRVLAVQYDLCEEPGREYEKLIAAIKASEAWCHTTESSWLVYTHMMPDQFLAYLQPYLHMYDKILITIQHSSSWAGHWLSDEVADWLHTYLHTVPVPVTACAATA